jgi:hypothetical protein
MPHHFRLGSLIIINAIGFLRGEFFVRRGKPSEKEHT